MANKALASLRAAVDEEGAVRLRFYLGTETFEAQQGADSLGIRIYRKEEPDFTFNRDYWEYFDAIGYNEAEILFEGELGTSNRRKFEYIDQSVRMGCTYCYWAAALNDQKVPIGPVAVKVRNPLVWWPHKKLVRRMEALASSYPDEVELQNFGHTTRKCPLPAISVGNRQRCIALIGALHAGESGPELILPALENLLQNDRETLKKVGIAALPSVNLDERERQIGGAPPYLRTNANGVDLNRNFPADWETIDLNYGLNSSDPDSATYRGPFPASEEETRTVMQFLENTRPLAVFSFHFLAGICSPFFLTSRLAQGDRAYAERSWPLLAAYSQGYYEDGREPVLQYSCSTGSLPHWLYRKEGLPAFDLEWDGDETTRPCIQDETTPEMIAACAQRHYRGIRNVLNTLS